MSDMTEDSVFIMEKRRAIRKMKWPQYPDSDIFKSNFFPDFNNVQLCIA